MRCALSAILLVSAVLASSCSGFKSKDPVVQTYVLQAGSALRAATAARGNGLANNGEMPGTGAAALAVSRPTAASGLDGERIAVIRNDGRFDYYNGSRWAGDLPDVIQTLLIDTARATGRYRAVIADTGAFTADELLQVEIRQFQAEYGASGPPTVHVVLEATQGRRSQREILRTVRAESRVAASADRMGAVIEAFNAAIAEALSQL
jgi:cholesterol transport system auxiliary component